MDLDINFPAKGEVVLDTPTPATSKRRGRPADPNSITTKIKQYKAAHPEANAQDTAAVLGLSYDTVRKVFSKYFPTRKFKKRKSASLRKVAAAWGVKPENIEELKPKPTVILVEDFATHPLYPVFVAAINQAMYGKGERHGGAKTPFLAQPWAHYAKLHGRGFLTGQAAKKLEEAASTKTGEAFEQEMLGAMVYIGMAILNNKGEKA